MSWILDDLEPWIDRNEPAQLAGSLIRDAKELCSLREGDLQEVVLLHRPVELVDTFAGSFAVVGSLKRCDAPPVSGDIELEIDVHFIDLVKELRLHALEVMLSDQGQ